MLTWDDGAQTLYVCDSKTLLWVRILASNPHYHLTKRVAELSGEEGGEIIAVFRGEISMGKPSLGPLYPVRGTLTVSEIISVERGGCQGLKKYK